MQPLLRPSNQNPSTSNELPLVQPVTSVVFPSAPATFSPPPSRQDSGMRMAHLLQPMPQPQESLPNVPTATLPYSRFYESASGSHIGSGALSDVPSLGSDPGYPSLYQTSAVIHRQPSPEQLQRKRAYKQRRKDPSCDSCRDRKVKCDASESTCCTECTNRKVRCQFTKETNRRMSSIKRVQDLEKQLQRAKQQLHQLRMGLLRQNHMETDEGGVQHPIKFANVEYRFARRPKTLVSQGLLSVQSNLRRYGHGILKMPTPCRQQGDKPSVIGDAPKLPPKNATDHLLGQYFSCIHSVLPVLHWPSFTAEYEKVYRVGSLQGMSCEWTAVLFAVFACGSVHTIERNREEEGKKFVQICCGIIDVWEDNFNFDRVRAALLVSVFLYEVNSKSASWVWIGSAVRVAQEIGLHIDSGPWPGLEGEMRQRLWWSLYTWDRLLALEMGKPVLINDQNCDRDLPYPMDEQYITEGRAIPEGKQQTSSLLVTIQIVRSIGQLTRTLRSPTISPAILDIFDRHFNTCLASFPAHFHPKTDHDIDPHLIAPVIYLQNARLLLHRHNISPSSPWDVRSSAIDYCVSIALDTARLLSRCMRSYPGPIPGYSASAGGRDWRSLFTSCAGTLLCTHIWRCSLLLLFRQEYAAAFACVQVSAAIGDNRAVNSACGRYLAFFLQCLLHRDDSVELERDEAMIAYVSGDMQGSSDDSWVWEDSETGSQLEAICPIRYNPSSGAGKQPSKGPGAEWTRWEWIEKTVQYLLSELQQKGQRDMPIAQPKQESSWMLTPEAVASELTERGSSSAYSRMTIANII